MTTLYLDNPGGLDECYPIVVVFLYPRGDGEDVGVKDDVVGVEVQLVHQEVVGAPADSKLALRVCRLSTRKIRKMIHLMAEPHTNNFSIPDVMSYKQHNYPIPVSQ